MSALVATGAGIQVLNAAHEIAALADSCAAEAERERRLPDRLAKAMAAEGVFRLLVPQCLGGYEADPVTLFEVVEAIATADGSAGWIANIGATSGVFAGAMQEDAAREIYGSDPHAFVAFVSMAGGRAVVVDGGFHVTGRWRFASGCLHATWLAGTCTLYNGETPLLRADGQPERRVLFMPRERCDILDTWHVSGLCGTGSNDFVATDVFVPASHSMAPNAYGEQPYQPGALYVFGRNVIPVGLAAVPLGIARGALDALVALAGTKQRTGGGSVMREHSGVQSQVGLAEAQLGAARAYLLEAIAETLREAENGGRTTVAQRGKLRLAAAHAAAVAAQVVDLAWMVAGAGAIAADGPFARRLRDVHAARQNVSISPAAYESVGRVLLGFPPPDLWA